MKYQGPCKSVKEILEEEQSIKPAQKILAQLCSGIISDVNTSEYHSFHLVNVWCERALAHTDQRAMLAALPSLPTLYSLINIF